MQAIGISKNKFGKGKLRNIGLVIRIKGRNKGRGQWTSNSDSEGGVEKVKICY